MCRNRSNCGQGGKNSQFLMDFRHQMGYNVPAISRKGEMLVGKLNSWLDRFVLRHPKFGIPNLMLYIAIANVAIGLLDNFSALSLSDVLFFSRDAIFQGQVWRLVTFIFVPLSGDFGILNFSVPGTSFFMTV